MEDKKIKPEQKLKNTPEADEISPEKLDKVAGGAVRKVTGGDPCDGSELTK